MSTSNHNNSSDALTASLSDCVDRNPVGNRGNLTNPTKLTPTNWLVRLQNYSKLLMAVVEASNFTLQYANDSFCRLMGITPPTGNWHSQGIRLWDLFGEFDAVAQEQLYRRHLLPLVLRDLYQIDRSHWSFLDEPTIVSVNTPGNPEPYSIQFWLRSEHLKVERIDPQQDEFADVELSQLPLEEILATETWENRLQLDNYRVKGQFLWEGLDVTSQEKIRRLIDLLIEHDSVLRPKKFRLLDRQLRSLFHADNLLLLSVKGQQAKVFTSKDNRVIQSKIYTLESLEGSHFMAAAEANRVWKVPNLSSDCKTKLEQVLFNQGVSSLLLIPLFVSHPDGESSPGQLIGMVGLTSNLPNNFDSLDVSHGLALIPALSAALRQGVQGQFSHIHPAVEWRFLEEAERRSWGLPPQAIVFTSVYPMYGICDIRGSSEQRNHAIQTDLLAQFTLAVAVVDAVCQYQDLAFLQQFHQDLLTYRESLSNGVMVDAEVTAIQYLRDNLEIYFDYFRQCGDGAAVAVKAYEEACANDHRCVYTARDCYDRMIHEINNQLRETWDTAQMRMQQILPHYCDVELTDGMDHMIYVGGSINQKFSLFHLHALRYEQLRAICECARVCFGLRDRYEKTLEVTYLVLVQDTTVDIFHDEQTEKLFDLRGSTRDTRYEIVKKRIDKAVDVKNQARITQPGMLTLVYSTKEEWEEYEHYLRYLAREAWVDTAIESGIVEPLQGITGLKFARVRILPQEVRGEG